MPRSGFGSAPIAFLTAASLLELLYEQCGKSRFSELFQCSPLTSFLSDLFWFSPQHWIIAVTTDGEATLLSRSASLGWRRSPLLGDLIPRFPLRTRCGPVCRCARSTSTGDGHSRQCWLRPAHWPTQCALAGSAQRAAGSKRLRANDSSWAFAWRTRLELSYGLAKDSDGSCSQVGADDRPACVNARSRPQKSREASAGSCLFKSRTSVAGPSSAQRGTASYSHRHRPKTWSQPSSRWPTGGL
jgi:hypothetical protein